MSVSFGERYGGVAWETDSALTSEIHAELAWNAADPGNRFLKYTALRSPETRKIKDSSIT